jgi:glycosyltransferase 2 family protein
MRKERGADGPVFRAVESDCKVGILGETLIVCWVMVTFPSNPQRATTKRMPRSRLRDVLIVLKLTVSTVLLVILFRRADVPAMVTRFKQMDPLWTLAALSVYGLMLGVSAWRWHLLLRVQTVHIGLGTLTKSFLVATFFNNFLPSNIGGDVVRVADTAPFTGSKTLATTVVLIDRILGLIALLVLAAAASALAWRLGLPLDGMQYVWLALVVFTGGLLLFLRHPDRLVHTVRSLLADRLIAVQVRVQNLVAAVTRFAQEPRELWFAFGGALIVQALLVLFYVCAAHSLAVPLPLIAASVIVPISLAVQMVPVSINGFGVREAVFAFFFTSLGLNVSSALTLSLGSAALIMLFSLSGGAVFMMRPRKSRLVVSEHTAELL